MKIQFIFLHTKIMIFSFLMKLTLKFFLMIMQIINVLNKDKFLVIFKKMKKTLQQIYY